MAHAEQLSQTYSVVWFKRDLRIADHTPLIEAAKRGLVFVSIALSLGYGPSRTPLGSTIISSVNRFRISSAILESWVAT